MTEEEIEHKAKENTLTDMAEGVKAKRFESAEAVDEFFEKDKNDWNMTFSETVGFADAAKPLVERVEKYFMKHPEKYGDVVIVAGRDEITVYEPSGQVFRLTTVAKP